MNEIGRGGMGVVYLAYHNRLKKYVVMKKIKNPSAHISMLRNEVDILKGLHHPYLPQVYDFIEFDGDLYTIIDYIQGYDLNYYINNSYIVPEKQLIKWLRQLCEVLDYLHTSNPQILHTDIKPGNIIITQNGDICLIDFGISLYGNVDVKGFSKDYSSPEQYNNVQCILACQSRYCVELDPRTDIYSLAATFYHLMTGVKPNITNIAQLSIKEYNLSYSDAILNIVSKAMSYDVNKRFFSACQMLNALDNIYKYDKSYKNYIFIQIVASLISCAMIVSGVCFIISGYSDYKTKDFESSYSQFCLSAKSGLDDAPSLGLAILNDFDESVVGVVSRGKIWNVLGEYYNEKEDYNNALKCFKKAIDTDSNGENTLEYYCNYVFALINDNSIDVAQGVLEEIKSRYPDSAVLILADAGIGYKNGDYNNVINIINVNIGSFSSEYKFTAYVVLGDCNSKLNNTVAAAENYYNALKYRQNISVLRKCGNSYLNSVDDKNSSVNDFSYKRALECFSKIKSDYLPNIDDVFNLSQTYLLLGNTEKGKEVIKNYLDSYEEDGKLYMLLAIISYEERNTAEVVDCCKKAHDLYNKSGFSSNIDSSIITKVKELYREYCGGEW